MKLNRDVLLSISNEVLADRAVDTSHVDLMQGLSVAPFMTRYAVVSDPVLTHLPKGTQTVITAPARAILSGQGIGAAYKRVGPSYPITDDVNAFIYEETRRFTPDEIEALLAEFYNPYPDWRQRYGNPMFKLAMASTAQLGDQWGKFEYVLGGTPLIHPGETTPTRAVFSGVSSEMTLSVTAACPGSDGVEVQLNADGKEVAHFDVAPAASAQLLTTDASATYELVVSKRANAWCDVVSLASSPPQ